MRSRACKQTIDDLDQMAALITKQMNVRTKRQFVQSTFNDIARQSELLLAQIQVKATLEGENISKLRQKLLQIEVMKPFMTYDALDIVDGTSKEQTLNTQREPDGMSINAERTGSHNVYEP